MHVLQIVGLIPRDGKRADDPARAVEQALEEFMGRGTTWFDWFQIGGRWDGHFTETFPGLGVGNVLSWAQHEQEIRQVLRDLGVRDNETYLSKRDAVLGTPVSYVEGTVGHVLAEPVVDDAGWAQRLTDANRETARAWQDVLAAGSLSEARARSGVEMAAFYVERMMKMLMGEWSSDCSFCLIDEEDGFVSSTDPLRFAETATARDAGYLVAVDFHF